MFQQFFEDTLMSRYIKGMLSYTNIPLVPTVSPGDIILEGCQYLYDDWIILCIASGKLFIEGVSTSELFPSKEIYPSVTLYPGTGEATASFRVLCRYYEENKDVNYSYKSYCNYYDSDTHYHLGQYLRYLQYSKGLNLLPYYNCYNYKVINDITLTSTGPTYYSLTSNNDYKLAAVPIQFGKDYTIAVDSRTGIKCRCVLYGDSGLLVKDNTKDTVYYSDEDPFAGSYRSYPTTSFKKPFTYRIDTNIPKLHTLQKNLYLLIQLPKDNTSSIVVLEGNHTKSVYSSVRTDKYDENDGDTGKIIPNYDPNLSLLFANCNKTFAFSDRLIEYLVGNVIDFTEQISNNITKVQRAMLQLNRDYYNAARSTGMDTGVWDDALTRSLDMLLSDNCAKFDVDEEGNVTSINVNKNTIPFMFDKDGNVNRDMERYFYERTGEG